MGLLDALLYGYRTILDGNGSTLPRRSRVRFLGNVTDNEADDTTDVDTGAGSGPVDTLVGDGAIGGGYLTDNASHILGDAIDWSPTANPRTSVKEIIDLYTTDGDEDPDHIHLFTAVDATAYALDVTATVWRSDDVVEKWKATATVRRLDSDGDTITISGVEVFSDATDQLDPALSLGFSLASNVVCLDVGDEADPVEWSFTVRVHRHQRPT